MGLLPCSALIHINRQFSFTFSVVSSYLYIQKASVFSLHAVAFDPLLVMALHVALGTISAYGRTYDKGLLPSAAPTSAVLSCVYVRAYDRDLSKSKCFI